MYPKFHKKYRLIKSDKKSVNGCLEVKGLEGDITLGHKEMLEVHYLGYGDGLIGTYICQIYNTIHLKYVQFIVCQLHLNIAV